MKSNNCIPLSVPVIAGNEWKYVKDCFDTGWVSSVGSYVNRFEEMVADFVGAQYAVATINGTASLHLGLLASGVKENDEVIVPALTFIAPVNVIRYCGASPVFMDCDETLCLDIQKTADFLARDCVLKKDGATYNKKTGGRVKAVIPVHIFGHPADMDALLELSRKYNIAVIEDATESIGSLYKGKKTGSFGSIGCFSFNGNKIITTGGGGMAVTNDKLLADAIRHLSTQAKKDPFEYDHDEIGYNYRLTNIQAAMGVAQMEKLQEFIDIKRNNAASYRRLLADIEGIEFLWEKDWARSNFWFYTIRVPRKDKQPLLKSLVSKNIQVRPIWKLMHTLPMYKKFQAYRIERAQEIYDTCFNLPCSASLKEQDLHRVVKHLNLYFKKNKIKVKK